MEDLIYGLIAVGIIIFIVWKVKSKKKNNNIGNTKKQYGTAKLRFAKHIEGIEYLGEGQECNLIVDDEKLSIVHKDKTLNISLEQIVNANILTKKEVTMKNKNAIGRGIVGGVLTGGVGLLLGGLSGVGQKAKNKSNYFLIINYKPKNTDNIKVITFGLLVQDNRFVKSLTKRLTMQKNIDL